MVDWNKTWIAVSQSGGGGGAILVGGGLYFLPFVNVANPRKVILAGVTCKRLGLVAHAGASHAIGIMLGVGSTSDMDGLTGGGWDFAADLGAKWGQIVKQGGRIGKWLKIIESAFKGLSAGARAGLAKGGEVAFSEAAKGLVNAFDGNFDRDKQKRGFYMFGTPLGVGLGAGVWYEWQNVYALGGPKAWNYGKPRWRLQPHGGGVYLQLKGIPEPNGADVHISGIRLNEWGTDGYVDFTKFKNPHAALSIQKGLTFLNTKGKANGFKFFTNPADPTAPPADGGLNIGHHMISGRYEYFNWGRGIRSTPYDSAGKTIELGLDVKVGGKLVWQSDEYIKVKVDQDKRIQTVFNGNPSKWRK